MSQLILRPWLNELNINKEFISVFGSGESILQIPKENIWKIKEKSFTIFTNYAPSNFTSKEMDMLIFSDRKVAMWLSENKYFENKNYLWYSHGKAFPKEIPFNAFEKVNYWFDEQRERFCGNYTVVWLLQALQKYFPNKIILLFGVDMYKKEVDKWYDKFTNYDINKRGKRYNVIEKLNQCTLQLKNYVKNLNIFNCNLNSKLDLYPKKDWKEILN